MKDTQIDNVSVPEPDMVEMATTVAFRGTLHLIYAIIEMQAVNTC